MRIAFRLTVILLSIVSRLFAQPAVEPVKGLATKEVYDLLMDHKGFIWVGHELGLSRINNGTFENFSNPQQASLSVTNLLEDRQGRIWCHNFSGQIFYVENGVMHLLESYEFRKEQSFPQMVINGNELFVTSSHGLFICDTRTLRSHYVPFHFEEKSITLAQYRDKIVLYNGFHWFSYHPQTGIRELASARVGGRGRVLTLTSNALHDTIYATGNNPGILQKITLSGNSIQVCKTYPISSFINAINLDNGKLWVHTRAESYLLDDPCCSIKDQNLTHILTDRQSNIWISSLKMGLSASTQPISWKRIAGRWEGYDGIVSVFAHYHNQLIFGTQEGKVFFIDPKSGHTVQKVHIPSQSGGIEFLRCIDSNIFISTSAEMYNYQPASHSLVKLMNSLIKDIDAIDGKFLLATSNALVLRPLSERTDPNLLFAKYKSAYPSFHISGYLDAELDIPRRCKAVRLENGKVIAAAFHNGLVEIDHETMHPVLQNHLQVYANSLEYVDGKLFIATPGNGLLIKSADGIRSLNTTSGDLLSNNIIKIKREGQDLWILEDNYIQVLDLRNLKIRTDIVLPPLAGPLVYDIAEVDQTAFISSKNGMYEIKLRTISAPRPNCFIDKVLVNEKDTLHSGTQELSYHQNNLRFFLSTSWYNNDSRATFKYRLAGKSRDWESLRSDNNAVQLESLTPGDYTFEALAEAGNGNRSPVAIFHFIIRKPWWQQWWFWVLIGLSLVAMVYGLYHYRIRQVMRVDNMRRKLSSDLHDNIGATLSCVNIYAELAKEEGSEDYADMIQSLSNEAIHQLRDMVWTINPRNDSYEQLVNRMHAFAATFFKAAGIRYNFTYDESLFLLPLDLQKRQNLYFIFKELVNNVVRHAEAANCNIEVRCDRNYVYLMVRDNGKGFSVDHTASSGNGINNILHRTEEMKGSVIIDSRPGTGTSINVKVPA